jgi:hypothetical protein
MFLAQCASLVSWHATDTILDVVERADAQKRFVSDWGWLELDHVMELAAHMRHAGRLDDLVAVKLLVATIAIRMHDAAEGGEMVGRMPALTVGAIVIGDRARVRVLIATPVEDIDPNPASLCLAPPRVENIDRSVVGMDSVDRSDMGSDQRDERRQQSGHTTYPLRHDGSGDVYPQPVVHLG